MIATFTPSEIRFNAAVNSSGPTAENLVQADPIPLPLGVVQGMVLFDPAPADTQITAAVEPQGPFSVLDVLVFDVGFVFIDDPDIGRRVRVKALTFVGSRSGPGPIAVDAGQVAVARVSYQAGPTPGTQDARLVITTSESDIATIPLSLTTFIPPVQSVVETTLSADHFSIVVGKTAQLTISVRSVSGPETNVTFEKSQIFLDAKVSMQPVTVHVKPGETVPAVLTFQADSDATVGTFDVAIQQFTPNKLPFLDLLVTVLSAPVVEIEINGSLEATGRYISYSPSPCRLRLTAPAAGDVPVTVTSRSSQPGGGEAVFYPSSGQASVERLNLTLPANGDWVAFGMGGKFGFPSVNDRDCLLAVNGLGREVTLPLMVRIRKNANDLTNAERDRFLAALSKLNNSGRGIYQDFRSIHVAAANDEEHQGPQFLPWHRTFILDLERELQAIDPAVSLPFWRFDQPAPRLFQADFMGATTQVPEGSGVANLVTFNNDNPLVAWVTDGMPGIRRSAIFNTASSAAPGQTGFRLLSQAQTLALGDSYDQFLRMEGTPHGAAHVSFGGSISEIPTAVKDPLFFMLHANVDRLWALWQWLNKRFDPQRQEVYTPQERDGRRRADTLWPWNGVVTPPRPDFAPGGPLPTSPVTKAPGAMPKLQALIDFQGNETPSNWLGYGYVDVPYEFS